MPSVNGEKYSHLFEISDAEVKPKKYTVQDFF
jgi:hypothetical protein